MKKYSNIKMIVVVALAVGLLLCGVIYVALTIIDDIKNTEQRQLLDVAREGDKYIVLEKLDTNSYRTIDGQKYYGLEEI